MSVHDSSWKLSIFDICNGDGIATVTLKSGVQLAGSPVKDMCQSDVCHLRTDKGWHTIDWEEIAAISGEPRPRGY